MSFIFSNGRLIRTLVIDHVGICKNAALDGGITLSKHSC